MRLRPTLSGLAFLVLALGPASQTVWADNGPYTVQDAGPVGGIALAVNANGAVAGTTTAPRLAFVTLSGSGPQLLPGLPESAGGDALAFAVHADGWAVGSSAVDLSPLPVTFQSGAAVRLSPSATMGEARAVNASGAIAGWIVDGNFKGVIWSGGTTTEVPGTSFAQVFALNDAGTVAGTYFAFDGTLRAFRWTPGGAPQLLDSLGGFMSNGNGIDGQGDVVGDSHNGAGNAIAVLWPAAGGLVELGTFGGNTSSARDVNNRGQVVGYAYDAGLQSRAFLWEGGALIDLNTRLPENSGWVLRSANAINDAGQIAGEGLFNGEPRAFLLTPPVAGDTTPPVISAVATTPGSIWPPRHQMVDVSVSISASDDSGETPVCGVTGVTSSEPDNGDGDGDTGADTKVVGPTAVRVRAERSGPVGSRVYTVAVQCADGSGNTATGQGVVVIGDDSATAAKLKARKK